MKCVSELRGIAIFFVDFRDPWRWLELIQGDSLIDAHRSRYGIKPLLIVNTNAHPFSKYKTAPKKGLELGGQFPLF